MTPATFTNTYVLETETETKRQVWGRKHAALYELKTGIQPNFLTRYILPLASESAEQYFKRLIGAVESLKEMEGSDE